MPPPEYPDDDEDDRPRRRRRRDSDDGFDDDDDRRRSKPADDGVNLLVPLDVSGWSIASCYTGLIGFCLPIVGLPFALAGLVCGIVALRRRKKSGTYGSITSDLRALIGVTLGGLSVLAHLVIGAFVLLKETGVIK